VLKLKIIDSRTNELASRKQRFLRNITWLLNWIEIIVFLASGKRLGDRLAKTEIAER